MLRIISMYLSLIAVITVNIAANTLPLNGKKTVEIMNSLPVLFIPESFVFLIWIIIYTFLAVWIFGFHHNRHKKVNASLLTRRTVLFIISSLLNISWFFLWHYEFFDWALLNVLGLFVVLITLYFTYTKNDNKLFERIPISLYLGWVMTAFIANVNYVLTLHEWNGWGISTALWTVIILTMITAVALHFMYHYRDAMISFVFMWAFVGIAVVDGLDSLFISSVSLFLTAVIGVSFFLMKNTTKYA